MTALVEVGAAAQVIFDVNEKGRVELLVPPGQRLYLRTPATSVKRTRSSALTAYHRHLGRLPHPTISFLLPCKVGFQKTYPFIAARTLSLKTICPFVNVSIYGEHKICDAGTGKKRDHVVVIVPLRSRWTTPRNPSLGELTLTGQTPTRNSTLDLWSCLCVVSSPGGYGDITSQVMIYTTYPQKTVSSKNSTRSFSLSVTHGMMEHASYLVT